MIALTLIVSSHRSAEDRAFYLTMWMCGCGEIDHTERLAWTVMDGCGFCRWPCTSCRSEIDKWKTPLNLRSCVFAIAIFFFQFPDIRCLPDSFLANLSTIKLSSCHMQFWITENQIDSSMSLCECLDTPGSAILFRKKKDPVLGSYQLGQEAVLGTTH